MKNCSSLVKCLLTTIWILVAVIGTDFGQKPPAKSSIKSSAVSPYASKPFDLYAENLLSGYIGHDIEAIYRHLFNVIPRKSEFETTDEYSARAIPKVTQPLPGNLPFDSVLAFSVPRNRATFHYDADTGSLGLRLDVSEVNAGFSSSLQRVADQSVILKEKTLSVKRGIATSAFGVKVRVTHFEFERFGIIVDNYTLERRGYELAMSPLLASRVKDQLRVLLLGRIDAPLISYKTSSLEATIDRPSSSNTYSRYVHYSQPEIWVYDQISGIVYFRIRDNQITFNKEERDEAGQAQRENQREAEHKAKQAKIKQDAIEKELAERARQKIEQGLVDPKILSQPRARYTEAARKNNVNGTVILNVTFLDSGQIGAVEVVSGLPDGLTEEAILAAQNIRFEPAKKFAKPITVTRRIQYQFVTK